MGRTVKPFFCLFLSFFAFPTVLGLLHQPLPSLLFLVLPAGAGGCASRPKLAQRMYSPSSTPVIPTEVPRSLRHAAEGSRQPTLSHHHPRTSTRFYRAARAATAPAAAPIANHFAARPTRRHIDPPLAACRALSRSFPTAWVLVCSSFKSACAAVNLAWHSRQSTAKLYSGFKSSLGTTVPPDKSATIGAGSGNSSGKSFMRAPFSHRISIHHQKAKTPAHRQGHSFLCSGRFPKRAPFSHRISNPPPKSKNPSSSPGLGYTFLCLGVYHTTSLCQGKYSRFFKILLNLSITTPDFHNLPQLARGTALEFPFDVPIFT